MLDEFIQTHMRKSGRLVPARLQSVLALLERLREHPSLTLGDHFASEGSSGLRSHETYGKAAHDRLQLDPVNSTHGRRSSHLTAWGQALLDVLREQQFEDAARRESLISSAQSEIAAALNSYMHSQPLRVKLRGRSAEGVIRELIDQADEKGKGGDVAQYLVGAKLELRLGTDVAAHAANLADRHPARDCGEGLGDFEVGDCVIEVALGYPDEKHLEQIFEAVETNGREVWILTRHQRVESWRKEISTLGVAIAARTVVAAIDAFVGQNITELGAFASAGKHQNIRSLIDIYNRRMRSIGVAGLAIDLT